MDELSTGKRMGIWFIFTACLPVVFVAATWAVQHFVENAEHPYAEIFGTGDLMLLAALLLVTACSDIILNSLGTRLPWHLMVIALTIMLLFYFYGSLKIHGVDALKTLKNGSYSALETQARYAWYAVAYAIGHATWVRFEVERDLAS